MEITSGAFATNTINSLVARSKAQLRLTTTDDDIFLELMCNEAIQQFDSLSIHIKRQCKLKVENGMAKLPSGFNRLIGIRLCCGENVNWAYSQLIYVDLPFLRTCGIDTTNTNFRSINGAYQIQGGNIFITNVPAGVDEDGNPIPITEIDLAFFGMNIDESTGLMVSYDRYERGVAAYACWMYGLQNIEKYNQYLVDNWRGIWQAQKRFIKSTDHQEYFNNNKRAIASSINAWISSKSWTT